MVPTACFSFFKGISQKPTQPLKWYQLPGDVNEAGAYFTDNGIAKYDQVYCSAWCTVSCTIRCPQTMCAQHVRVGLLYYPVVAWGPALQSKPTEDCQTYKYWRSGIPYSLDQTGRQTGNCAPLYSREYGTEVA